MTPPVNDNTQTSQSVAPEGFEQSFFEEIGSPVDFGSPWMLGALPPALLIAFLLMRSIERRAKEEDFPAMFILEMLENNDRDPDRMPLWQQMINYGAITAAVIAVADPSWKPQENFTQDGPVIVAIDNGWDSSENWESVMEKAQDILRQAHNDDRQVRLVQMAAQDDSGFIVTPPMDADAALQTLSQITPMPMQVDYAAVTNGLKALTDTSYGASYWLGSGLDHIGAQGFASELSAIAPLRYVESDATSLPYVMGPAIFENGDYRLTVRRADSTEENNFSISAYAQDDSLLASYQYSFAEGQNEAEILFDVPDFISNDALASEVFRFSVDAQKNAAANLIVDDQWKPRSVGLVVDSLSDTDSLLSEARFINTALEDHAELFLGRIEELVESGDISVLIVPDAVTISGAAADKIQQWVEGGGTLVRFAGPNMARQSHANDPLLPLDLRQGARSLSANPSAPDVSDGANIGSFNPTSPLRGIALDGDIEIHSQIMVQPGPDVSSKIWASLDDGTPLVSADQKGEGQVILFHTTANTAWGELPLSDNFVDILLGVVASAKSVQNNDTLDLNDLSPLLTMNGFGTIENPPPYVMDLQSATCEITAANPPGLYGSSLAAVACNLSTKIDDLALMGEMDSGIEREFYAVANDGYDLRGTAWSAFLALMLASTAVLMAQQGEFRRKGSMGRRPANEDVNNKKPIHEAFVDDVAPDFL